MDEESFELIKGVLRDEPVVAAYLYGSVARGLEGPGSDVDIGLLFEEGVDDPRIEARVSVRIEEALGLDRMVEARTLNDKSLVFIHQVLKDGVVVYSRDDKKRVGFENLKLRMYFDFKPCLKLYDKSRYVRLVS